MHFPTCSTLLAASALFGAVLGVPSNDEVPYTRSYFYVGGNYVDDGAGGHIFSDQMYVEKLTPIGGTNQTLPLVFIHGQGQTGTVSR